MMKRILRTGNITKRVKMAYNLSLPRKDPNVLAAEMYNKYEQGQATSVWIRFRDGSELLIPDEEFICISMEIEDLVTWNTETGVVPNDISADDMRGLLLHAWMYHRKQC